MSSSSSMRSGEDEEMREARREQKRLANEQYNQKVYNANQIDLTSMNDVMNQM